MKAPALFSKEWFDSAIAANRQLLEQKYIELHKLSGAVDVLVQQRELAFPDKEEVEHVGATE